MTVPRCKWEKLRNNGQVKQRCFRPFVLCQRVADVGATVGTNPNVSQLYSCVRVGDGEGWWVIDRWIEGKTLEHRLENGPWPRSDLPRLMKQLLNGLAALHSHNIVLREMTPARVLIPEGKRPPILTDFEMAKIFNGTPTVRNGVWPPNPFRAPEVESGKVGPSADLFSWAVVLLNAATGIAPDELPLSPRDANSAFQRSSHGASSPDIQPFSNAAKIQGRRISADSKTWPCRSAGGSE